MRVVEVGGERGGGGARETGAGVGAEGVGEDDKGGDGSSKGFGGEGAEGYVFEGLDITS